MTIGKNIRELRKKQNLTQENLAELLGVSFQAVSKWENGLNAPDLSLIAPLTRLFHVTADELLGLTKEQNDERLAYFEEKYADYWKRQDHEADLEEAKQAAAEYPQDGRFLYWLASDEFYTAFDSEFLNGGSKEHYTRSLESSLRHYIMAYDLVDERKIKDSALHGIVLDLVQLGRFDEARQYAELMPESSDSTRDDLIVMTLRGREKRAYRQKMMADTLQKFLRQLIEFWEFEEEEDQEKSAVLREATASVIEAAVPDGNYLVFNEYLYDIRLYRAFQAAREGDADRAVHDLLEAKAFAEETDRLARTDSAERFTCPMFDSYEYNGYDPKNEFSHVEYVKDALEDWRFDTIRSEPEFRDLLQSER